MPDGDGSWRLLRVPPRTPRSESQRAARACERSQSSRAIPRTRVGGGPPAGGVRVPPKALA
jgi:hypothetical protein